MAWHRPGDKPLSEPMRVSLLTHICIIPPQWVKGVIIKKQGLLSTSPAKLLTLWGRVTHICVRKLTIFGSDNGLSPEQRQAIIWSNAGILLSGPLGINFSDISIKIHTFSFKNIDFKRSSGKWRPFCLGLNVLTQAPGNSDQLSRGWVSETWWIDCLYGSWWIGWL